MNDSERGLLALGLSVVMVLSVVSGTTAVGAAAANGTDGTVSLSVATAGNQATVSVDDADLNTNAGAAETHIVNVNSNVEGPTTTTQASSDTADGGTQTVTVTDSVSDRNNDNTIDANDFTLVGGAPDESITTVAQNGGDYDVTISDAGSSTSDSSAAYVRYDKLTSRSTGSDTDQANPTTITTTGPAGDRNGDGDLTAADVDLVQSTTDESITNVARNADGTIDVTITDSTSDGDDTVETIEYLKTETVKLSETGAGTGTFEGSISVKTGFTAGNDELLVRHQGSVSASYVDSSASTTRTSTTTYKLVAASATSGTTEPSVGESVTVDGTGSSGSISSYSWDTDNDGSYDDRSGSSFSTSFSSAGVYTYGLQVDDGSGNTDTDAVTFVVGDSGAPTADLQVYPLFVTKDETAYLVAQNSSDDLTNGIKKYEWDVGADGSWEYSSTRSAFAQHTFTSTGDHDVKVRVTDYAGNTDTYTETVTVQGKASVSDTSVDHTGNGTAPTGSLSVSTRNEGGMLKLELYRGASQSNRDLSAAGVDESTELWVNVTIDNYEPNAMMASAKVDEWTTSPNSEGPGTNISIKMHPINMQRLDNPGTNSPGRWPSTNKQADTAITPGGHLAMFDMPDGTQFESDFDGATLTSDAQLFSPPRYDSQKERLTYTVAAPHWKATGSKVDSNTNTGFYEAWIPPGLVTRMGIEDPSELAGTYKSNGKTSSLSNMEVEETSSGGLYINVTGIHYSSGSVQLEPDNTAPTADAGSDVTTTLGTSVSLDASSSSDNRKIQSYDWDVSKDGSVDATGESASHTFSSPGTYTVELTVTDGNGNTDTDTMTVTVTDGTAPTADAGSDTTVDLGNSVSLDGSASSDNDGISSYDWDVDDDGSYDESGSSITHTYDDSGGKTVTLKVTDPAGNTATDTVTVTVESTGDDGNNGTDGTDGDDTSTGPQEPVEVTTSNDRADVHVREPSDNMSIDVSPSGGDAGANSEVDVTANEVSFDPLTDDEFTMNVSSHASTPAGTPTPSASDVGGDPVGYVQIDHSVDDIYLSDARLTVSVSRAALAEGTAPSDVVLYRYHDGEWVAQETSVVSETGDRLVLEAELDGMSVFAVGYEQASALSVTDASLDATTVTAGDSVTVSSTVTNDGTVEGSMTVELTADGAVYDSTTVTVPAGESTTVDLSATFETAGEYALAVAGADVGILTVDSAATPTPTATAEPTATATPATTATATPTVTPVPTDEASGDTPTATPTPTATATPTASADGPAPGLVVSLLAVVLGALALARRRRA